jgi:riboflavin biosynthesis pyrimidine reductase
LSLIQVNLFVVLRIPADSPVLCKQSQQQPSVIIVTASNLDVWKQQHKQRLESLGVNFLQTPIESGQLQVQSMLTRLKEQFGVQSMTVEGGTQLMSNLINSSTKNHSPLIDRVIVTVLPTNPDWTVSVKSVVGNETFLPKLSNLRSCQLGDETIVYGEVDKPFSQSHL